MLLHVQPVGEDEHEGNAEFVVGQPVQFLLVNLHGKLAALFPQALGEGNGVIVLVDRIGRVLDVDVQRLDGLGALVASGDENLVSLEGNGRVLDFHLRPS